VLGSDESVSDFGEKLTLSSQSRDKVKRDNLDFEWRQVGKPLGVDQCKQYFHACDGTTDIEIVQRY